MKLGCSSLLTPPRGTQKPLGFSSPVAAKIQKLLSEGGRDILEKTGVKHEANIPRSLEKRGMSTRHRAGMEQVTDTQHSCVPQPFQKLFYSLYNFLFLQEPQRMTWAGQPCSPLPILGLFFCSSPHSLGFLLSLPTDPAHLDSPCTWLLLPRRDFLDAEKHKLFSYYFLFSVLHHVSW